MEWVETTGKTIEEAKDAALDQLGVDEQDAEFEVVDEGKVGLFGRVRNEARVRARVRPTTPRAKEDRRDRKRRGDQAEGGRGPKKAAADGGTAAPAKKSAPRPAPAKEARAPRAPRSSDRPKNNNGGQKQMDDVMVPMSEQSEIAEQFLRGLLNEFGKEGQVATVEVDEDTVEVQVTGDDLGLLIGPKGNTLSALQDVTRTVVQRRTGARNGRLLIDVTGYRAKRREALARFTRQVADQVLDSGTATVLEPMSAADRKVVHDTVNDIDGLATSSQGEEPRRRVVISPT